MDEKLSAAISFVLGLVLGYATLLSGVWYLMILSGLVVGLLIPSRWTHQIATLFVAGIAANLIYLYPLFADGLIKLMRTVGLIAGLNGGLLLLIMLLISGAMSCAGSLLGVSIRDLTRRGHVEEAGSPQPVG
ncbi:MAG: hypothetical protein QW514_03285 [Thermoprotei archaeon]